MAEVLNISLDYSIHFPESHTDGSMKKKVHVYSGRNPGHCQGNTAFKQKDVLDENSQKTDS